MTIRIQKRRFLFFALAVGGLLLLTVLPAFAFAHLSRANHALGIASLSTMQQGHDTVSPSFDSRPCVQQPSDQNCSGVLAVVPHGDILDRDHGSGACFNGTQQLLENQSLSDGTSAVAGTFQLWFLPACGSYATHVLATSPTFNSEMVKAQVEQYNAGGNLYQQYLHVLNGVTTALGAQDSPLPSASEQTGPVQDNEVWSPLLYSPSDPIEGSGELLGSDGTEYAPFSAYYADARPTTVNNRAY